MNEFHHSVCKYRECSRHVRNAYFQPSDNSVGAWDVIEGWQEVDRLLFDWMVLYPHGLTPVERNCTHPQIEITIRSGAPVFINREKFKCSGYWDHPVTEIFSDDCALSFREFFDFDQLSQIDFNYVMAEISEANNPDLNRSSCFNRMAICDIE